MKFLNITFLLSLFASASAAAVFGTVIVPLKSNMHHLIWLIVLYVSLD